MKKDTNTWGGFKKIEHFFHIDSIGYTYDRIFPLSYDYTGGEQHDFIEMVYVISGDVEVIEKEKVYILKSGDLILHAPMEFHSIRTEEDANAHVLNLSIITRGNPPDQLFDGVYHLYPDQRETFMTIFNEARRVMAGDDEYRSQLVVNKLAAFLIEMCLTTPVHNNQQNSSGAQLYKQLVKDMQKSVYDNVSIHELAQKNSISVSYVKKLFQNYAKVGPKYFYDSLRIQEATLLLNKGMLSANIAEKMNFSSPNYFTIFFKKHTGMTPSEFKNKQNKKALS